MNSIKNISFDNTEKAFITKKNNELKQSLWLFKIMKNPFLVKMLSKLTIFAIKIGLPIIAPIKATIFKQFCAGESINESEEIINKLKKSNIGSILDYSVEGKECEEDFNKTKIEILKIIAIAKDNSAIPYTSLKLTGIARMGLLEKINFKKQLNQSEEKELQKLNIRLYEIANKASEYHVPIYLDAEESWIQDAIDLIAEKMMREFNQSKAIILTTLQMYRWDRINYLNNLINDARTNNYKIGIKLVRGAYMERENLRAHEMNYKSPIQINKERTDKDFDKAVKICLENIDIITLCVGTHNEASTMYLIELMKKLNITNDHPNVYFSQLYGMSDHISYNLSDAGYNVTKYLPYGPVKSVIPYLIRRAEENTSISGQMSRELRLLLEERERRKNALLLPTAQQNL